MPDGLIGLFHLRVINNARKLAQSFVSGQCSGGARPKLY